MFDLDDIDAAFEELDARYLAGEAATYAHVWSLVVDAFAAINRHELPSTPPDFDNIDHRRGAAFAPGELMRYLRAGFELTPDLRVHIEAVHQLSELGAVITLVVHGTSQEGFDAEWRGVELLAIDRVEVFDEADIDAAIARFEELQPQRRTLENSASRAYERIQAYFAARDWDAMGQAMADNYYSDDRRRVLGAGVRHGRDAEIAGLRATADLGVTSLTSVAIAIRGDRLALCRTRGATSGADSFHTEVLSIVEIDADDRIAAVVVFDPDDIDAAFEELDARYLEGEAAAYAHTWSVITQVYAALNRHELPTRATNLVNADHRRGRAFLPGDLPAYIRATWDLAPDVRVYIEAVHRLSNRGAVMTHTYNGISQEGFDAEWREITMSTVDEDLVSRCEMFDEADLDAALARFDELDSQRPQPRNAASQVIERFQECFAARDWHAMAETLADDVSAEDRRAVVRAVTRRGRDTYAGDWQTFAEVGFTNITSTVIATRGERLVLSRHRVSRRDQQPHAFVVEVLAVVEIDGDDQVTTIVAFGPDDVDAALEELDARYLAGEAAAHSQTWSVIARARAALVRHELPRTTPDWVNVDHRRGIAFAPGDMTAYFRAGWDTEQDFSTYIEAVHRLNDVGAVFTQVGQGTTHEGFDAEWRIVEFMTVEGDLVSRAEFFDEADIDAAIARFDQLSRPAQRWKTRQAERTSASMTCFAARDWDALAEILADDISYEDRRRVVNAGLQQGRDAVIAEISAVAEVGVKNVTTDTIATRGERLALIRGRWAGHDPRPDAFHTDALDVVEIDGDGRVAARVVFDPDDIDAAFEELEARYLVGEGAAHAHTWSIITQAHAVFNRRELPAVAPDLFDHRPVVTVEAGDPTANIRAMWDLTPDLRLYIEAVHRLSDIGAVFTQVSHGTSQAGFEAEWRVVELVTVEDDLVKRGELFDEADIDDALARFDESAPRHHGDCRIRQANWPSASWRTTRHTTGTPWRKHWPTTFPPMIAVV